MQIGDNMRVEIAQLGSLYYSDAHVKILKTKNHKCFFILEIIRHTVYIGILVYCGVEINVLNL